MREECGIQLSDSHSFLSNSSWSTVPVIYASMRAQIIYRPYVAGELDFYALSRSEDRVCSENPRIVKSLAAIDFLHAE